MLLGHRIVYAQCFLFPAVENIRSRFDIQTCMKAVWSTLGRNTAVFILIAIAVGFGEGRGRGQKKRVIKPKTATV